MKQILHLSNAQKRIYFQDKAFAKCRISMLNFLFDVSPEANIAAITATLNKIRVENDVFQLRFTEVGENLEPRQYLVDYAEEVYDFIDFNGKRGKVELSHFLEEQAHTTFSLLDSKLYYFAIVKKPDNHYAVFLRIHHLISDGWSVDLLAYKIKSYTSVEKEGCQTESSSPSYLSFLQEEAAYLQSSDYQRHEAFWLEEFATMPQEVNLSLNENRPEGIAVKEMVFTPEKAFVEQVMKYSSTQRISPFKQVLAALSLYIYKLKGLDDFCLGTVNHNRGNKGWREMMGMFVSTFPVRFSIDENMTFSAFAKQHGQKLNAILKDTQAYPFNELALKLRDTFGQSPNYLLNIMVAGHPEFDYQFIHGGEESSQLLLHLYIDPQHDIFNFQFYYNTELFNKMEVTSIYNGICAILSQAYYEEEKQLSSFSLISPEEQHYILDNFEGEVLELPEIQLFHHLFEKTVECYPDYIALVFKEQRYSYKALNEVTNQLAGKIRSFGLQPDDIIGIYMDRSADMIISLLAVMKSGAAYMPIDQDYPMDRIKYMLSDSKSPLLLTKSDMVEQIGFQGNTLLLDKIDLSKESSTNLVYVNKNSDLVYVIYTSGSTGKPKGVMVEHHSLVNMAMATTGYFDYKSGEATAAYLSFGFDGFGSNVYPALCTGMELHILANEIRLKPLELNDYFHLHSIKHVVFPTQFGSNFLELVHNESLKTLTVGGEKLRQIPENCAIKIINAYGPTEATVQITYHIVDRNCNNIPIGRTYANNTILILNEQGEMMPIGLPGELCIVGNMLARGYLGKPEQTAKSFVDCPIIPGERMYKTGDLVRWLPDGNIEYLGRIDMQVKIRGYRVELGEIEMAINKMEGIEESVVLDLTDKAGGKYLCSYYISATAMDLAEIKSTIGKTLPEYMVPEFFVKIDAIPLTPNGKVDRRALPEPTVTRQEGRKPTSELELKVAKIWQEALHVEDISATDNFFELGGQSLVAAIVQARVQQQIGVVISLNEIFTNPTVEKFAKMLENMDSQDSTSAIVKSEFQAYYPLTPQQRRLFVLHQMEKDSISYNVPGIWKLTGELDEHAFAQAIDAVVENNSALRTAFVLVQEKVKVKISKKVEVKKSFIEEDGATAQELVAHYLKPFNLNKPPLFRIYLVKTAENEHYFLFDAHHIIVDGASLHIFINEVMNHYSGAPLVRKMIDYQDYAVWYSALQQSDKLKKAEKYWLSLFQNANPTIDLPTDYPRPTEMNNVGKQLPFTIPDAVKRRVSKAAINAGTTTFNLLLTAYAILLKKYTRSEDFVIGIPSLGRSVPEVENTMGMFVNTIPIKVDFDQQESLASILNTISKRVIDGSDNQDYQLDTLIDKLGIQRSSGRNPFVEVMFTYIPANPTIIKGNLTVESAEINFNISKFDLTMHVAELEDTFKLIFEYRTALFKEETMMRMGESYALILAQLCDNLEQTSADVEVISPKERDWVLHHYNNTKVEYDSERSVIELFEDQVAVAPKSTAVVYQDRSWSYAQINEKANILAHKLRAKGVQPNDVVGVIMERSPEVIIAFLAINKAGAAYVPIDPEYPSDRILYILENSATTILLSKVGFTEKLPYKGTIITLDVDDKQLFSGNAENPQKMTQPSDLVYLIYTSGSTGKPKGVMITQQGLINYIQWAQKVYLKGEQLSFPLYSSISFDLTVTSIFTPLVSGCKIIIYSDEDKSMTISKIVRDNQAGVVKLTPTHLKIMENESLKTSAIKRLIVGGEELQSALSQRIHEAFDGEVEILNEYGPTETVVGCMIHQYQYNVDTRPSLSIGVPADNARIYLLDDHLKLVPKGVIGEMYIAGDGVARGYMNRPDITAERFLMDPFFPGERMYKAGDLARFIDDKIEFCGRVDFQVKIHGFRIELNEIETQLAKHPEIVDLVVVARKDSSSDNYLCAYYVSSRTIPDEEMAAQIKESLPDYMVPSWFVKLEKLPLTPNGKTDTKNLPDPTFVVRDRVVVSAHNKREQFFVDAFKKVLDTEDVSLEDNFFSIGGNSLKAVSLTVLLQKEYDVNVNDIFKYQTPEKLAETVQESEKNSQARLMGLRDLDKKQQKLYTPNKRSKQQYAAYAKRFEQIDTASLQKTRDYHHILLTGSTGFLGIWLLHQLLHQTTVTLYLPVRAKDDHHALQRVKEKWCYYFPEESSEFPEDRIVVFKGNLEEKMLGVTTSCWKRLTETIDAIINPAANVRHYGEYDAFYKSNVESVINLLELCKSGGKTVFNQVSTISIGAGNIENEAQYLFTEEELDGGQKMDNVYLRTKMEAEKVVVAAREEGIDTTIFRIGNITFDSVSGRSQENVQENGFFQVVNALISIGAVPQKSIAYEFSFVDKVADAILTLYNREELMNNTWHIQHDRPYFLDELLSDKKLKLNLQYLPFNAFLDQLIYDAEISSFATILDNLMLHRGWLERDQIATVTFFYSDKSNAYLRALGFEWPEVTTTPLQELIRATLNSRMAFLNEVLPFKGIANQELFELAKQTRVEYYLDDSDIVQPIHSLDNLLFLQHGFLEVSMKSSSGWTGTLVILSEKDSFGLTMLYDSKNGEATVTSVLGEAVVVRVPISLMKRLIKQNPTVAENIIKHLSNRTNDLSRLFVND